MNWLGEPMVLSEDKISHLSHLLLDELKKGKCEFKTEESVVLREIKRYIQQDLQSDDEVDQAVRRKLLSYSKKLIDGSPEWNVLYAKFFEEQRRLRKKV